MRENRQLYIGENSQKNRVKYKMIGNRQAIQQQNISLKVKSRFINLLFANRQIGTATYCKAIACFIIIFVAFLGLSVFFFIQMYQIVQVKAKYYNKDSYSCRLGQICEVAFRVDEVMKQPIRIYYQLGTSIVTEITSFDCINFQYSAGATCNQEEILLRAIKLKSVGLGTALQARISQILSLLPNWFAIGDLPLGFRRYSLWTVGNFGIFSSKEIHSKSNQSYLRKNLGIY